jgi:glucose-6-phosphate isomerase
MGSLQINYFEHALIEEHQRKEVATQLLSELQKITEAIKQQYQTEYASLFLPQDDHLLATVEAVIAKKKLLEPRVCILVAIGGSNLGTLAVFEALNGLFYNQLNPDMRFYYADTIDTQQISSLLILAEKELQKSRPVLINIVTKSGTTTETLINAAFFVELIKKYYPETYHQWIVVTTDRNSPVWLIAQRENYSVLEIPTNVGGRYSVLSAVGLFPLGLLGVNIRALRAGAFAMLNTCLSLDIEQNSALQSAVTIFLQYQRGKNIHDSFIFKPALRELGDWYRQLVGESLGKSSKSGITPTVSVGTTDLHSVAQLYLGGPLDKLTTFIFVAEQEPDLLVPKNEFIEPISYVAHKPVQALKEAIFKGVLEAYRLQKRPFMTILFPELTAYTLGQFLMFKMCEVIFTAKLLDVNAFDQPAVELYKSNARKLLKNE